MANFMSDYYGDGVSNWSVWSMGGWGLIMAPLALLLIAWTIYWKYQALWYAAKHDHKWWFLALIVIHTLGILEILYLHVFSKKMPGHNEKSVPMVSPQQ